MKHTIYYTLEEPNKILQLNLKKGDYLSIKLDVKLGTGYRWELLPTKNKHIIKAAEEELKTNDKMKPGAAQTQVFNFKADTSGEDTLIFNYVRPWERTLPFMRQLEIIIYINKA